MMTMVEDSSAAQQVSKPAPVRKSRRRLAIIAISAAVVLVVAAGITATSVQAAERQAQAEETARQCTVATAAATKAMGVVSDATAASGDALGAVASTALPDTDGWQSTPYAERAAVAATDTVPALASGAEMSPPSAACMTS
jgi:hypothetical protein